MTTSSTDDTLLEHLTKTVGRANPTTAKYADMFDLDDLTSHLVKEYEEAPHSSLTTHNASNRGVMRRRAIVNLKLHLLFRSDDCLQMTRGSLFEVKQDSSLGSHWGPLTTTDGGQQCPEWVFVRLTKTKTSGMVEHKIPFCPSEPALCPVLALYVYVKLYKGQKLASYINQDSSIWLGVTAGREGTDKGWTGGVRPWSTRRNATGQLTERQRAAMLAAADEQARERQAAAERHRRLRGQSANKRSAARRRRRTGRRHRREWDASAAAEAALAGSGAASARLTAGRADRMTASTAQSEFIGQDVLYVTPGHSKKNTVRAVTWNAGKAFRGAKFDFFLDYITAREDDAGTRPGFDFASVQELGPSWARGGQAWLWQTPGQKARARAVAEKPGMDTPTSARQRRQRSREVWAAEKEPEPGRNTGWRSCFTQHAMLAWRAEWESRRWGQPTVTPDGRTIGAQFSTATGRVGVISHYGLVAPAQLEEEESAAHGMNSANVQRGLLDMLADFKDNCKLVVVLGDLNVQRRQDRLDLEESGAPDVAHKLWLRLTKGGGLGGMCLGLTVRRIRVFLY